MGDVIDRAAVYAEKDLKYNLASVRGRITAGESLTECEDCGREIPEKRRAAVPGCVTCVACQEEREM